MRMVDTRCPGCEKVELDVLLRTKDDAGAYVYPDCGCGTRVERVFLQTSAHVIGDEIPGGVWVRNGICNDDGTPRRYDSKSEMARVAKEKGVFNFVRHQGRPGSDKNKNTQRFV